jgi:prepilin-type processing-associated H-X9-DG protein
MTKLGKSSTKIFCADGGRLTFSYNSQAFITEYTLTADPANTDQNGTMFADLGPFSGDSHAWDRSCIPGNAGSPPTTDLRPLAYRHGARSGFQKDGSYLLNAVFYDGHAETLDGPDSSNPALWLPSGSMITASTGVGFPTVLGTTAIYVDVAKRYGLLGVSATKPWIVP